MSILSTLRGLWGRIFGRRTPTTPTPPKSMLDDLPTQTYSWVQANSSAISKVLYQPYPRTPNVGDVIIVFANYPKQYRYYNVPISVYQDLLVQSWKRMRHVMVNYSDKSRHP